MDINEYRQITAEGTVLVEFFADWCPHCRRMKPVVEDLRQRFAGRVEVYQSDIDDNPELSSEVGVQTIPTFIIYHAGEEMWRGSGEIEEDTLIRHLQNASTADSVNKPPKP